MTQHPRRLGSMNDSTARADEWLLDTQDGATSHYARRAKRAPEIATKRDDRVAIQDRRAVARDARPETSFGSLRSYHAHGGAAGSAGRNMGSARRQEKSWQEESWDDASREAPWEEEPWEEEPWRNRFTPNPLSPQRDREATIARPIQSLQPLENRTVGYLDNERKFDDERERDDALDTLIIFPTMRPPAPAPDLKSAKAPKSRGGALIGIGRTLLISLVLYYILSSSLQLAGGPGLPLAPFPWAAASGAAGVITSTYPGLRFDGKMVSRVRPMTQMRRADLYDSRAQFNQWAGSACSAASLAEVLTAYGLPNMTIGRMIREFGRDISSQWGLLSYYAFNRVVAKYGLRADVYLSGNPLSYKQMLYLTNTLGIPVIVNVRATTGYYHYLSGGHILVMTGGNNSTIRLVDSSLYYIKSLPLSTYNWMARPRNVVIVPKNFHYKLPH